MNYREAFHRNFNSFMTEAFTYRNQSIDLLCKLPTNCLSVFDHFVGLALKGLIKWFHYRYFPGKCPTISENNHKKHFSFEVRNSELLACNVEKKEQLYRKIFLKFSKFQNNLSFLNTSKKVNAMEFLVRQAEECGPTNLSKGNSPTYFFSG